MKYNEAIQKIQDEKINKLKQEKEFILQKIRDEKNFNEDWIWIGEDSKDKKHSEEKCKEIVEVTYEFYFIYGVIFTAFTTLILCFYMVKFIHSLSNLLSIIVFIMIVIISISLIAEKVVEHLKKKNINQVKNHFYISRKVALKYLKIKEYEIQKEMRKVIIK